MAWAKIKLGRSKILVLIILVLGAGLRLWGSWLPFIHDGVEVVPIARAISLHPRRLYLPVCGTYHGPFLAYASRLSSWVFGESPFGWRFATLFFCVFSLLLIYLLVKDGLGRPEALFAMALLAFNPVHIFYSKYNVELGSLMFLATLLFFCLWKALRLDSRKWMLVSGVVFGIAMMTHLSILFAVPGLAFLIFFTKGYRKWLKRKELYLALLISLGISTPYLLWNYTHNWFHYPHGAAFVEFFRFSGKAFNLFLGNFFVSGNRFFDSDYGYEYMDRFSAMVLSIGIFYSTVKLKHNFVRMVYLVFWSVAGVSLLFVGGQTKHFILALIPAPILASTALGDLWHKVKKKRARLLVIGALVVMLVTASSATYKFGDYWVTQSTVVIPVPDSKEGASVDMTTLARGLIDVAKKYSPGLVVLPGGSWLQMTGAFIEAYSGWKVVSILPQHRWRKIYPEELQRTVVLLLPQVREEGYRQWASKYNFSLASEKTERATFSRRFRGHLQEFSLPVRVLVFEAIAGADEAAGEELVHLVAPLD